MFIVSSVQSTMKHKAERDLRERKIGQAKITRYKEGLKYKVVSRSVAVGKPLL
jgi:hypothetical protein